ncbi:MAG: hypothetical protein L0Y58_07595 [Verrucomicrobia subdivision 3 bacterium]|nr:hypothetical protein [Limisphaerales bacterium]
MRVGVLLIILGGFLAQETRTLGAEREAIPPAAWQRGDPALADKWKTITGRFIYQQACTECHSWGPDYWPRRKWEAYLKGFPQNHQPDVRDRYKDLTAMFAPGKMVPNLAEERDALATFILSAAPPAELPKQRRDARFHTLPEVGQAAPNFAITDAQGRRLQLSDFKDKRALVLVFSRAHW